MKSLKLLRVVGARPEFIHVAALRRAIETQDHQEILLHTGQHYDDKMSRVFFEELGLPAPDINLGSGSGGHGEQTGRILSGLDKVFSDLKVDAVIVYGDTNSTLAGALGAAKWHIPVIHIEAGLRSFDRRMPEELNRIVADHLSDLLCAPTGTAITNLEREGLKERATLTGDLAYDTFLHFKDRAHDHILTTLELKPQSYIVATVHRAENTDNVTQLHRILSALAELPLPVIFPVHPRTRPGVEQFVQQGGKLGAIRTIPPVTYLEMVALERQAQCILTDSGGVQREAFFAGVPSVILRDTSEWQEQVQSGWSILAGAEPAQILSAYETLKSPPGAKPNVYGDGQAAAKMVAMMEQMLA